MLLVSAGGNLRLVCGVHVKRPADSCSVNWGQGGLLPIGLFPTTQYKALLSRCSEQAAALTQQIKCFNSLRTTEPLLWSHRGVTPAFINQSMSSHTDVVEFPEHCCKTNRLTCNWIHILSVQRNPELLKMWTIYSQHDYHLVDLVQYITCDRLHKDWMNTHLSLLHNMLLESQLNKSWCVPFHFVCVCSGVGWLCLLPSSTKQL